MIEAPKLNNSELQELADKLVEEVDDMSTFKQKVFRETVLRLLVLVDEQAQEISDLKWELQDAKRDIRYLESDVSDLKYNN